MHWNSEKSLVLTKVCIAIFALLYVAVIVLAPSAAKLLTEKYALLTGTEKYYFLVTVYTCALPLGGILWLLRQLIKAIGKEEIFTTENIARLRYISWFCFAAAAILMVSAFYAIVFIFIAACAGFMGLLIRVVKNVFARAKELKDENDYTI